MSISSTDKQATSLLNGTIADRDGKLAKPLEAIDLVSNGAYQHFKQKFSFYGSFIKGSVPTGSLFSTYIPWENSCGCCQGHSKMTGIHSIKSSRLHKTDTEFYAKYTRKDTKINTCSSLMKWMSSNTRQQHVMSGQLSGLSHTHTVHYVRTVDIGVVAASHYSAQAGKLCTTGSHLLPCYLTSRDQQHCHPTAANQCSINDQGCS